MQKVQVAYLLYSTTLPMQNVNYMLYNRVVRRLFLLMYILAGSVIRMFLHALGEDTFKKGLSYYLTAR